MRLHGSGFGDWGWCGGCLPCRSRDPFLLRLWVCFNLQSQHHSSSDWRFSNLLNHPEMAACNFFPSLYEPFQFLQLACNLNTVGSWLSLVQSHMILVLSKDTQVFLISCLALKDIFQRRWDADTVLSWISALICNVIKKLKKKNTLKCISCYRHSWSIICLLLLQFSCCLNSDTDKEHARICVTIWITVCNRLFICNMKTFAVVKNCLLVHHVPFFYSLHRSLSFMEDRKHIRQQNIEEHTPSQHNPHSNAPQDQTDTHSQATLE